MTQAQAPIENPTPVTEPVVTPPATPPVVPTEPIQPTQPEAPQPDKPRRRLSRRLIIILTASGIILLLAIIFGVWYWLSQTPAEETNEQPTVQEVKPDSPLDRFISPQSGETWQSEPEELEALGLFKSDKDVVYRQVGSRGDNIIIHSYLQNQTGQDSRHMLFEQTGEDQYTAMLRPQNYNFYSASELEKVKASLSTKVVAYDTATQYDSLSLPHLIDLSDNVKVERVDNQGLGSLVKPSPRENTRQLVTEFGASRLFRLMQFDEKYKLNHVEYQVEIPLGTRIIVKYIPHNPNLDGYSWKNRKLPRFVDANKVNVFDKLDFFSSHCWNGQIQNSRLESVEKTSLTEVGATDRGVPVYQFADPGHSLMREVYRLYEERVKKQSIKADSYDDFINYHAVVLIPDDNDSYHLYIRNFYRASYQCILS